MSIFGRREECVMSEMYQAMSVSGERDMRERVIAKKLDKAVLFILLSFALIIGAAWSAQAGYSPQGIVNMLHQRGYYDVRIKDVDDDEVEVYACRNGILYELEVRYSGRIKDIDREGRCGPGRHAGKHGAHVHAPYASVHTGRGEVDVRAPFTGVHVGRHGTHVRAPFVDLFVPRR